MRASNAPTPSTRPPSAIARTSAAGALVAGAIAALDLITGGAAGAAPTAFGLAALVGGFGGAVFALLVHGPRSPRRASLALGAAALTGLAAWAIALGAIRRWGSAHHALALGLWVLVPAATAGVVALGVALRIPRGEAKAPSWMATRTPAMAFLTSLGVLLAFLDGRFFPDTYPLFHDALRTFAWLAGTAALAGLLERRPLPERARRLAGGGLLLVMPLALMTAELSAPTTEAIARRPWAGFVLERLRAVADVDGDAFAGVLHGGDCAPFDPAIGPAAVEVPGNGVDDDCVGGDVPAWLAEAALPEVPATPSPRSVVLITVDALRADRLGIYGHERPTSPNLDRFFARGQIFERAYTAGGYTSIALPALMRGAHARRIRWARVVQTSALRLFRPPLPALHEGERWIYSYTLPIDDPRPTWPLLLERRGMAGVGIVDDGASDFLSPRWGTGAGFERFRAIDVPFGAADGDDRVIAAAERHLAEASAEGRTFAWLHLYGPHWPDSRHADLPAFGDGVADRYDHEVAHVDRVLGPLLEHLAGRSDPPVVILTSDHGEVFHADGRSHGRTMAEEAIRVPLLVWGPGIAPGRRADVVSSLDISATILALTETPAPAGDGRSLLAEPDPERVVLVDSWVYDADGEPELDLTAAVHADGKLVVNRLRRTRTFEGDAAERPRLEATIDAYFLNGATPRIDGGNLAAR